MRTALFKPLKIKEQLLPLATPYKEIGSISKSVMTEWTPEGQAGQTPKSLGVRVIRSIRETFVINENEVIIGLGASGVNP
jgi:hypothetical protein